MFIVQQASHLSNLSPNLGLHYLRFGLCDEGVEGAIAEAFGRTPRNELQMQASQKMMQKLLTMTATVIALAMPGLASAQVVLTKIVEPGDSAVTTEYTFEELAALAQTEVKTNNDYVEDSTTFTGPRIVDLFDEGAIEPGDEIVLTALNDYSVTIPAEDVLNYDVILAIQMNGERMSVREKGPIWVIYPMDEHPELREASYNDRLIWQLSKIELK